MSKNIHNISDGADYIRGVEEFIRYKIDNPYDNRPYSKFEIEFGIVPYATPGNRAKKIWTRFNKSGLDVDSYLLRIRNKAQTIDSISTPILDHSKVGSTAQEKPMEERSWTVSDGSATFVGKTTRSITTLEEALEFSKVDLNVWEVSTYRFKSWDVTMKIEEITNVGGVQTKIFVPTTITNYGCEVNFKQRTVDTSSETYLELIRELNEAIPKYKTTTRIKNTRGIGVLNLADFHIGAEVTGLISTPDFNMEILVKHLNRVVDIINEMGYSEVHVNMLGDYFESISGLNHLNTFKSLQRGMYGANVIILASQIIVDFLSKIINIKSVNIISGNHDRFTPQSDIDNEGGAAHLLAHIAGLKLTNVEFNYHTYVMTPVIDDITYMMTHGHYKMDKKTIEALMLKYSKNKNSKFTVWVSGHLHSRTVEKTKITRPISFDKITATSMDEADYRKIILPPIFTGNFYSESLGYSTCGGFVIIENNGHGKPNVFDFSL